MHLQAIHVQVSREFIHVPEVEYFKMKSLHK